MKNLNLTSNLGLKFAIAAFVSLMSAQATAIDVEQCPEQILFKATVKRVYKESIYDKTPGWQTARQNLAQTPNFAVDYSLTKKTEKSCLYKDQAGNYATLTTTKFYDSEDNANYFVDQLIVNVSLGEAKYVAYIPTKSYSTDGVVLYSSPFDLKIKARLASSDSNEPAVVDLGMISVTID